jgi:hypothetical protein
MKRERTDRWTKMRLSRAQSSGPAASCRMLPSVDCITTTSVSEFSVYTGGCDAGLPQLIFMGIAPKKSRLPISTPQWRRIA